MYCSNRLDFRTTTYMYASVSALRHVVILINALQLRGGSARRGANKGGKVEGKGKEKKEKIMTRDLRVWMDGL